MRVLLLTHGTRGDVQPFVALALALTGAGHTALLAGPSSSASLAEAAGIDFHPVDEGPNRLLDEVRDSGGGVPELRGLRGVAQGASLVRRIRPLLRRVFDDMADAAEAGADLVVHIAGMPGRDIAAALGAPNLPVALQPSWVPTNAFPAPGVPWPAWTPDALNPLSYRLAALALRGQRSVVEDFRGRRLRLPSGTVPHDPLLRPDGGRAPLLQPFSRHLLPPGTGYPPHVHTTGFWYLPPAPEEILSPDLDAFLGAGDPPVFVGFSSMPTAEPEALGRLVVGAARRAGVRAVVASGWGGIAAEAGDDVLVIDRAPHALLFPRCAAVVHHGGAGTIGAALAAGRPQVVCPFWGDQPFWARRVHASGVGTAPLRGQDLTEDALARALSRAVRDPLLADRARTLGEAARAEDGTGAALTLAEAAVATG
ncbi:glycosyltransferase [Nocardiopsis sp. NPDC050513]|uniref:glycosyltransferase n=1 Tax=Nocardiopsis sp. NPDC050513 TaxID=3364338 RepID=UPI0037A06F64